MTFDEYEQKQHEVDMFKMQVQCAICGVLGINAGDTDGSTFHFRRVSDTDIEYHTNTISTTWMVAASPSTASWTSSS